MLRGSFFILALCLPVFAMAADNSNRESEHVALTISATAGLASTFQMPLGGSFGEGPDFLDTLTASLNNALRSGDNLNLFGWNSTDLPTSTADWMAGITYETRLLRRGRHSLTLTPGVQRWVLPNVASGAKDWLFTGNLTYATSVKNVPIFITENSWSLLKSTLPTGSAIYTQVQTQHRLLRRHGFELSLRQGPGHAYSWGFYGLQGNCAFHYGGSLVAAWKGMTLTGGYRQQLGLQDAVPNGHYWEFSLTRQLLKVGL